MRHPPIIASPIDFAIRLLQSAVEIFLPPLTVQNHSTFPFGWNFLSDGVLFLIWIFLTRINIICQHRDPEKSRRILDFKPRHWSHWACFIDDLWPRGVTQEEEHTKVTNVRFLSYVGHHCWAYIAITLVALGDRSDRFNQLHAILCWLFEVKIRDIPHGAALWFPPQTRALYIALHASVMIGHMYCNQFFHHPDLKLST